MKKLRFSRRNSCDQTKNWLACTVILAIGLGGCGDDDDGGGTDSGTPTDGSSATRDEFFSEEEWATIAQFGPLEAPPPEPTNRYSDDAGAQALGQMLFFEPRYSGPIRAGAGADATNGGLGAEGETGKISCASCHLADDYFSDSRSNPNNVSLGTGFTPRNSPPVVNMAYYDWFGWSGRWDSLWSQGPIAMELGAAMNTDRCRLAHVVWDLYRTEYDAVFTDHPLPAALDAAAADASRFPANCKPKAAADPDGPWEMMTAADQDAALRIFANVGKAIAAYERLLISVDAPFDRYLAGDFTALSDQAKRGLRLFIGDGGCESCHSGPFFSDNDFHNIGVPQEGPNIPAMDPGRFGAILQLTNPLNGISEYSDDVAAGMTQLSGLAQDDAQRGAFRTSTLRNVTETGRYFHGGHVETLRGVVEFYNEGGADTGFVGTKDSSMVPLDLTDAEIDDIVALLETLTGQQIPANLREDTHKP